MLLNYNEIEGTEFTVVDTFSIGSDINEFVISCKKKFKKEKKNNVIRIGDFYDNEWIINNGVENFRVKFELDELSYHKFSISKDMKYREFMDAYKAFIVSLLRRSSLGVLVAINKCIHNVITDTKGFDPRMAHVFIEKVRGANFSHECNLQVCLKFAEMLPSISVSEFVDEVNDYVIFSSKKGKLNIGQSRRRLPDYYSIFIFDKVINHWWQEEVSIERKMYYYPVYLWWKLTTIIPLRVTEYTVIPNDCVKEDDDKFFITLRRSSIKGFTKGAKSIRLSKLPKYHIDKDYKRFTYEINEEIYNLIKYYKDMSSDEKFKNEYCKTHNTLFNNKLHKYYGKFFYKTTPDNSIDGNDEVYKSTTLRSNIYKFQKEVVESEYGIKVLNEKIDRSEEDSECDLSVMSRIKPGDTRHIAMINMCLSDISPILIRDFVNHRNIDTTYHYIENTKSFVKCFTYMKYKKLIKNSESEKVVFKFANTRNAEIVLWELDGSKKFVKVDDGKCYSSKFVKGDITDCIQSSFNMGDCDGCDYFKRDVALSDEKINEKLKYYEDNLDRESKFFTNELRRFVREKSDDTTSLTHAMMMLKSAAAQQRKSLELALKEKLNEQGD